MISGALPVDVAKHHVSISTFINTIREFIETEFSGLIEIDSQPIWDISNCIRISEDYTAYFFKNFLAAIYGRGTVSMDMTYTESVFTIRIHSDGQLPVECKYMNELLMLAGNSGFTYRLSNTTLTLKADITVIKKMSVRSISINRLRAKFVEIFFTGGPTPDFTDWD
jgi:hypothetical protein